MTVEAEHVVLLHISNKIQNISLWKAEASSIPLVVVDFGQERENSPKIRDFQTGNICKVASIEHLLNNIPITSSTYLDDISLVHWSLCNINDTKHIQQPAVSSTVSFDGL